MLQLSRAVQRQGTLSEAQTAGVKVWSHSGTLDKLKTRDRAIAADMLFRIRMVEAGGWFGAQRRRPEPWR